MVCGWEDLAVLVVVSCIMVCQERERGQGEKLLQDEAVRVTMLPLVSLLFSCFTAHASPHPNTSVEKSPVLKRACPFKQAFGKIARFMPVFL